MFKAIEGLPEDVIGFEASGRIEADDYRNVLVPAIDKAKEANDRLRALIVLGDDYEGLGACRRRHRPRPHPRHRPHVRLDVLRRDAHVQDGPARRRQEVAERDLNQHLSFVWPPSHHFR